MLKRKCRIMYNIPVLTETTGQPVQTVQPVLPELKSIIWKLFKAVGIGLLIALVLVEIWALYWFMCALDDVCYAANTGGL
jgi:hypothetical protein